MADNNARRHYISSLDIRDGHDLAEAATDAARRIKLLYVLKHCYTPRGLRYRSPPAMSFLYQAHPQVTEHRLTHGHETLRNACIARTLLLAHVIMQLAMPVAMQAVADPRII